MSYNEPDGRETAVPASRYVVFLALAVGGCALDLLSKHWAFAALGMPGGRTWWIVDDVFGIQTSLNEGALFGFGQGAVHYFALISVVALVAILYWLFVRKAARDLLLTVALGFVGAGIFGNLYDRLGLHGLTWNFANDLHEAGDRVYAVRDWVLVMIGDRPWPNFNVADSLLVAGVGVMLLHTFFFEGRAQAPQAPATQ